MLVVFTTSHKFVSVVTVTTGLLFVSVSNAAAPAGKPDMLKLALVTPLKFTWFVIVVEFVELIGTVTRTWPERNRIIWPNIDGVVPIKRRITSAKRKNIRLPGIVDDDSRRLFG